MKVARLVIAATCISAGVSHVALAQQMRAPARAHGTNGIGRSNAYQPAPTVPGPHYSSNLGIHYQPVRYSDGTTGLRLTAAPVPGSPASRVPLGAGDEIFALSGRRLTHPNDVANHSDHTTVNYLHAATNTTRRGNISLPRPGSSIGVPPNPWGVSPGAQGTTHNVMRPVGPAGGGTAPASAGPRPIHAENLGVHYQPLRYSDGTMGLRLTAAIPGSPTAHLPLKSGDVIFAINGQHLTHPEDVAKHVGTTTVDYMDSATNTHHRGTIILPPAGRPSGSSTASRTPYSAPIGRGGNQIRQGAGGNAAGAATGMGGNPIGQAASGNAGNAGFATAMGGNQIGQGATSTGTVGTATSMGGNPIGQGAIGNVGQPLGQAADGTASPLAGPPPVFARNLGIYYQPMRYSDGTMGLRLTAAIAGSPAAQVPLEAGDVVYALDGRRFTNPEDLANHFDQTTIDFLDAETNTYQRGTINLASQNP